MLKPPFMTIAKKPKKIFTSSSSKRGHDEGDEGEEERRRGREEWDPDGLVELVGQKHQKD